VRHILIDHAETPSLTSSLPSTILSPYPDSYFR
jgi:hypothetical protein